MTLAPEAELVWSRLSRKNKEALARRSFPLWTRRFPKLPDTLEHPDVGERPWYDDIYPAFETDMDLVFMKATQVGITTATILYLLWGARYHHLPKGFCYYLPHAKGMGDLVREKIDRIIGSTPSLYQFSSQGVDNIGMKRIGKSIGYFRGLDSPQSRKTITVDTEALDEFDDMNPLHVDEASHRMDDSKIQKTIKLGVPTIPGFGIDAAFNDTTKFFWGMTCKGCHEEWKVEAAWPTCTKKFRDGEVTLACPKCSKPTRIQEGEWICEGNPESQILGFSVNGLMNPNAKIAKALDRWEKATDPMDLTRNFLGKAVQEEGGHRLIAQALLAIADQGPPMLHNHPGPTWMGVDVGKSRRTSRFVILDRPEAGKDDEVKPNPRMIHAASWKDPKELSDAMEMFHVERCVIDAGGEPRLTETFCKKHSGRAYGCIFGNKAKGRVRWNDGKRTVVVDRTESLDLSHNPLYSGAIELPATTGQVRLFADECQRIVRVVKDLPGGSRIARWMSEGADHYRFAFNYGWIAMMGERPRREAKILSRNLGGLGLPGRIRHRGIR